MQFLKKHPAVVVTVALHLVFAAAALGFFRSEFDSVKDKVRDVEQLTAAGRETRWIVDGHTRDIADMRAEQRRQGDALNEVRSDLKVVLAWVRQQQDREARAEARPKP